MTLGPRDRVLLGIVPVLALCVGFYLLLLTPQRHEAARLQPRIAAAQAQLVSAQQSYDAGRDAEVQLTKDVKLYSASRIAVPQVSNIPAMLRLLQRSADEVKVSIESISLSGGSSASGSASSTAAPTTQDGATAVPVALTFTGGYQALNRLVTRLDRYVVVSSHGLHVDGPLFGIGAVSETPNGGSGLSVQLTTNIYQYAPASTVDGQSAGGSS